MEVEIQEGPEKGSFTTTTTRTNVPQGEKLEQIMKNLANTVGIGRIFWKVGARGAKFYRTEESFAYQSASNTILQLSEMVAERFSEK